jgi:hypothetical protein
MRWFRRFLGDETRFVITDASLEWGGLHDIGDAPWMNPHKGHRAGTSMDVRSSSMDDARKVTFELACSRARLRCILEGNPEHYHLQPP